MASILVIEDHESLRMLLKMVLKQAGHEVREASNGLLGLAAYRKKHADLVVTDICMPEMNGLDLILELTSAFLNVKVVAMSGEAQDREPALATAKLFGARHTLRKPFSMETFLKVVQYELIH